MPFRSSKGVDGSNDSLQVALESASSPPPDCTSRAPGTDLGDFILFSSLFREVEKVDPLIKRPIKLTVDTCELLIIIDYSIF